MTPAERLRLDRTIAAVKPGVDTVTVRTPVVRGLLAELDRLRADLAARDVLILASAARIAAASEVLGRAAERGCFCARCGAELITEGER